MFRRRYISEFGTEDCNVEEKVQMNVLMFALRQSRPEFERLRNFQHFQASIMTQSLAKAKNTFEIVSSCMFYMTRIGFISLQ